MRGSEEAEATWDQPAGQGSQREPPAGKVASLRRGARLMPGDEGAGAQVGPAACSPRAAPATTSGRGGLPPSPGVPTCRLPGWLP